MARKINKNSPEYIAWYREGKKIWVWKSNLLRKNSTDATQVSSELKDDMVAMATWYKFITAILIVLLLLSIGWNIYLYIN